VDHACDAMTELEIADLLAPGAPIVCQPWLKPLASYNKRLDVMAGSGAGLSSVARFG
jgi:hypothetical protein